MAKVKRKTKDGDDRADDNIKHGGKMSEVSSVDSSSYDTTEHMTDTDSSAQLRVYSPRERSSVEYNRRQLQVRDRSLNSSDAEQFEANNVRFALNAVVVHEVESHNNFTGKERSKYWWSDREKDRMMAKHERLVAKYEQQKSGSRSVSSKKGGKSAIQSYRGLESWTAAGSLKLDHTIDQCITAVMDEQDRQWEENDDDADKIAQKSLAVTEDSARRARLNGLQDAQEALKVRSELWGKSGSDEMSVGSAISTGTAALVKKKKRSKLLARLDDSAKLKKNPSDASASNDEDAAAKKDKKKKKKKSIKKKEEDLTSSTKKKKKKPSKEKSSGGKDLISSTETPAKEEDDLVSTVTPVPNSGLVSSFLAGPEIPVSPLSTFTYPPPGASAHSTECPLLAMLRRQQEQLRQESRGLQDDTNFGDSRPNYLRQYQEKEETDYTHDVSPLLQTLRRQQQKQASAWQLEQKQDDPSCSALSHGATLRSYGTREDCTGKSGDGESADSSDPPGRRPRRLVSRHAAHEAHACSIPENSILNNDHSESGTKDRSRSESRDRSRSKSRSRDPTRSAKPDPLAPTTPHTPATVTSTLESVHLTASEASGNSSSNSSVGSGKRSSLGRLRNGAKTLFKKSAKRS